MNISYKINNKYLLHSVDLPLQPGKIFLITGIENNNLSLLGGIIGKLFPVKAKINIPWIMSLVSNFTGKLEIKNGMLPKNAAYVSSDPDRHFLFATIKEELLMIQLASEDPITILKNFGLDRSFYERKIVSLSGGEKMKLALALTFAKTMDCYVLHGIIPWLDQTGRDLLIKYIKKIKNNSTCIIFIEHEFESLVDANMIDNFFWFDGQTTSHYPNESLSTPINNPLPKAPPPKTSEKLLEFIDVSLDNNPFFDEIRPKPILNHISFSLKTNSTYALVGNNGAGKSTIAQILFRIIKPTTGTINFLNQSLLNYSRTKLNELICYVGQFPTQQIILSTIGQYQVKAQKEKNILAQKIFSEHLVLPPPTPVTTLTFFQMKLLVLANNINSKTKLIILDEPTWGIDKNGQQLLWQIIQELQQQLSTSLFLISHDIILINRLTTLIINLTNGTITTNF